jgi:hypothetical protein
MYVSSSFVPNAQPAELIQPGERPFHHPAPSSQSTTMLGVALGKGRHDTATQTLPDCLRVVATVAYYAIRTTAGTSLLSL